MDDLSKLIDNFADLTTRAKSALCGKQKETISKVIDSIIYLDEEGLQNIIKQLNNEPK